VILRGFELGSVLQKGERKRRGGRLVEDCYAQEKENFFSTLEKAPDAKKGTTFEVLFLESISILGKLRS